MLSFENTMVCVTNPSWHISYAMKLWLNYAHEGFDGGLVQNCKSWGLDYMNVGEIKSMVGDRVAHLWLLGEWGK